MICLDPGVAIIPPGGSCPTLAPGVPSFSLTCHALMELVDSEKGGCPRVPERALAILQPLGSLLDPASPYPLPQILCEALLASIHAPGHQLP